MRLLAVAFGLLALACLAGAVPAIVAGHVLQGMMLFFFGILFAGAGGHYWEQGSR